MSARADPAAWIAAINLANSTSAADTLVLTSGCTDAMTSAHSGLLGADALPASPLRSK